MCFPREVGEVQCWDEAQRWRFLRIRGPILLYFICRLSFGPRWILCDVIKPRGTGGSLRLGM